MRVIKISKAMFWLFIRLNTSNAAYHYTYTLNESQKMHTAINKHLTLHYSQSTFFSEKKFTLLNLEKPPLCTLSANKFMVGWLGFFNTYLRTYSTFFTKKSQ